ncbi:NUDIX hydrolase [Geomonas subterranea]|uniref:NUDIX hydrolase n=1 Tax=Geomonas subterranea TaxID=2847989 RepID=A0ABX8LG94_9BACT|nr:NUDIX hydrolase [Geomonas subterranea]QXE89712.1 NUDIX hydrolase [Geomonas subterranea]QXM08173.1 NUDIX hydrolase [Geomonas subterranea]
MTEQADPRHTVVVGCLVRNAKDEILVIRHRKRGWEIPQGRVEEGENLLDAARREVAEEAGVEVEIGPLAAVWSMVSPTSALIFAFLGRYLSGELNPTDDSEAAAWVSEAEALKMVTSPVMRERLTGLLNHDGGVSYRSYAIKPYQLHLERNLLSWP